MPLTRIVIVAFALASANILPAASTEARRPLDQDRPCPTWGPGFVQVAGSTTCIRLKGRVAMEAEVAGRRGGSEARSGSGAKARLDLETRSDTDYGPVRTFVRVRGERSTIRE